MDLPRSSNLLFAALAGVLSFVAVPSSGLGHAVRFPRVVHLRIEPERTSVAVAVVRHAGPDAGRMRSQFDMDSNGVLSEEERDGLARWLDRKARPTMRMSLDDVPLRPETAERHLELDRGNGVEAGDGFVFRSVDAVSLVLLPGIHTLVLSDQPESEGSLVPWRVDLPEGWTVTASTAEGNVTQAVRAGEHTWQTAFSGTGGSLELLVLVPATGDEAVGSADP